MNHAKIGALKSDLFETIEEKFSPRSSDPTKKILLWGNNLGREEGENIAVQMRKISTLTEKKNKETTALTSRKVVEFPHTAKTALPPRLHEFVSAEQKRLAAQLPQSLEELKSRYDDPEKREKLVETCFQIFATRSQSCLGNKFAGQRKRYIEGKIKLENQLLIAPQKKQSVFPKYLREAAVKAFDEIYQEFRNEQISIIKEEISLKLAEEIAAST